MKKFPNNISDRLDDSRPSLSLKQKGVLWNNVESEIILSPSTPSPFLFSFITTRAMVSTVWMLVLVLGLGGTVLASESARPGDLLFPVDRAVENIRLALARTESKTRLRTQFAEERLQELRSILDNESTTAVLYDDNLDSFNGVTITTLEVEADVFTDITIIKIEINNRKSTFTTSATTREGILDVIVERFAVERAYVDAILDFQIENRASRPKDRGLVTVSSPKGEVRVENAVDTIVTFLSEKNFDGEARNHFLNEVLSELENVSLMDKNRLQVKGDDIRLKIRTMNEDSRLEIRDGDNRVRIREKDSEIRVDVEKDDSLDYSIDLKSESDSDDDTWSSSSSNTKERQNGDDEDSDSNDEQESNRSEEIIKIEVRVEGLRAEVRMEYNGIKDEFTTTHSTRAALVAQLALRTGLSETAINSALDYEVRN